ncbi:MAG: Ig-like domain-containing protein [Candidatus Helarchaeota archaeon]
MSDFIINGIYPDYAQISPRNIFVAIRFSRPYKHESINDYTVLLARKSDNKQVAVNFKHDDAHNTVILQPLDPLDENTEYIVIVLGLKYNNVNENVNQYTVVQDINGNPLPATYSWWFKTNDKFDESIPDDVNSVIIDVVTGEIIGGDGFKFDEVIDYTTLRKQEPKLGYLSVIKTNPIDFSTEVDVKLGHIDIFLNDKLGEKHRNYLSASNSPLNTMWMVDDQNYLKSFISVIGYNAGGFNNYTIFQPIYEIYYNDNTEGVNLIRIQFDSNMRSHDKNYSEIYENGWLEYSTTYIVTLRKGLDGVHTKAMEEDFQFGFTTLLFPKYSEPEAILFDLGNIADYIPSDTINKALYRFSVLATVKFNNGIIYSPPPDYIMAWVECNAELALIRGVLGSRALLADQRKTLDIFTIEYGPWGPVHHLAGLIDDLKACIEKNEELAVNAGYKTGLTYGVRAAYSPKRPIELWSYSRMDKYTDRHERDPRGNDYYSNFGRFENLRRRTKDWRLR